MYAQTIAGRDAPTHGEAKNSWLTGTAAWNYVAITQAILGIRPDHAGLVVAPVMPSAWSGFTATREFRSVVYNIEVIRVGPGNSVELTVEGALIAGDTVPFPSARHHPRRGCGAGWLSANLVTVGDPRIQLRSLAMTPTAVPDRRIKVLAWSMLWLTVAVVVGGALVRATDSGAGCGETWPICGGQLIPDIGTHHTAIEVSHRLTTGLLGIVLVSLFLLVRQQYAKGHYLRRAVFGAGMLLIVESLLGASLVIFGWVEYDASIARLIVVPIHLINTFLLVGSMALVAYFASGGKPFRVDLDSVRNKVIAGTLGIILLIGATGALNALADTLILSGHLRPSTPGELHVSEAVLRQIRSIHPFTAIIGGIVVFMLIRYLTVNAGRKVRLLGIGVQGIIWIQFVLGLLNIALEVPLEIQLVHLFVADVLWILSVLIACNLLGGESEVEQGALSRAESS